MTPEIVTIGVYGWREEDFFGALARAGVDTFCDVRQRRGVRGADYAFANSKRLQARLAEMGIRYVHCRSLAPDNALRAGQHAADREAKVARRQRQALSPSFVGAYREQLRDFDSKAFVAELGPEARTIALFCVERDPAACHRSLLAERLAHDEALRVTHITP
jgi:uncharacterized protein (DUF488 family)